MTETEFRALMIYLVSFDPGEINYEDYDDICWIVELQDELAADNAAFPEGALEF